MENPQILLYKKNRSLSTGDQVDKILTKAGEGEVAVDAREHLQSELL